MSDKRKSKKWYKNIWIWLIALGVVLCAVNIVFACIYNREGANIFTAISGWVSGIATVILGIVAIVQNRKYKEENDKFLEEQQQLNWKLEQKDLIKSYLRNIENIFSNVKEYQYSKLISKWALNLQEGVLTADDLVYDEVLNGIKDEMIYASINSIYYFEGIEDLLDLCCGYTYKLRVLLKRLPEIIKNGEANRLNEITKIYKDLCVAFNNHIFQIRLFIDMIMANGIYDDIEKTLQEKKGKQEDWRKRIKTANEEFIKKWKN